MAFDSLTEKLQNVFKNLRSKGRLTEADVKEALKEIGGEIVSVLPRSESVQEAENLGKTVIEALPESAMADAYRKLAAHMIELSAEVENNYE